MTQNGLKWILKACFFFVFYMDIVPILTHPNMDKSIFFLFFFGTLSRLLSGLIGKCSLFLHENYFAKNTIKKMLVKLPSSTHILIFYFWKIIETVHLIYQTVCVQLGKNLRISILYITIVQRNLIGIWSSFEANF